LRGFEPKMTTHSARPRPFKRKGFWYLSRRVPKPYRHVDKRPVVLLSTSIRVVDDPQAHRARQVVEKLDAALFARWRGLAAGRSSDPKQRHEDAVATAADLSFDYLEADAVAALPIVELTERIERLGDPSRQADQVLRAVLGTVEAPPLLLSQLRDRYEGLAEVKLRDKSERQLRRWRTTRDLAIGTFMDIVGDKPVADVNRDDVLLVRKRLQERVLGEEIEVDTANKIMGSMGAIVRFVNDALMLRMEPIFDKAKIDGKKRKRGKRPAYAAGFVQERLLADGVFADLNEEARRAIYLVCETGLRLSEACNLNKSTIILDHAIPYVRVRPDGREMKTEQSEREIPLVGVALMAMKAQPDGFLRYVDKADTLSALVNQALKVRGLSPNGETFYSLRHTFKDRLRAAKVNDELKDVLMGHTHDGPDYGAGYSLESKAEVLRAIAFRPPSSV
jgi:integrase